MLHILNKGLLFGTLKGYKLYGIVSHVDVLPAQRLKGWGCNKFAKNVFTLMMFGGLFKEEVRYLLFLPFLYGQVNAG